MSEKNHDKMVGNQISENNNNTLFEIADNSVPKTNNVHLFHAAKYNVIIQQRIFIRLLY